MKKLSRTLTIVAITILLLSTVIIASADDSLIMIDSARVIYQTADRVYLGIGTRNGINSNWMVSVDSSQMEQKQAPLIWCNQDVSYFINSTLITYQNGDMLELTYQPDKDKKNYVFKYCYPAIPSAPHKQKNNVYDLELTQLLSVNFSNVINISSDSSANSDGSYTIKLRIKQDSLNAAITNLSFSDIINSLKYMISTKNLDSYILQALRRSLDEIRADDTIPENFGYIFTTDIPPIKIAEILNSASISILKCFQDSSDINPNFISYPYQYFNSRVIDFNQDYKNTSGAYFIDTIDENNMLLLRNKLNTEPGIYPDSLAINVIPEYLDRKLAFQMGEIDILDILSSDREQFREAYSIYETSLPMGLMLSANNSRSYLKDGVMLTALSYLINKESLCRVALGDMAEPLAHPDCFTAGSSNEIYAYNPGKGKSLLRNASNVPKYLSLYIQTEDYISRRTAEYIRGILTRQNIFLTIYSANDFAPAPSPEQFQEFDFMLSYIDLSLDRPLTILNQMNFHYDLHDITDNNSLFHSEEFNEIINEHLYSQASSAKILTDYYRRLSETPSVLFLLKPRRITVTSRKVSNISFTPNGCIDFSKIELVNETEK